MGREQRQRHNYELQGCTADFVVVSEFAKAYERETWFG